MPPQFRCPCRTSLQILQINYGSYKTDRRNTIQIHRTVIPLSIVNLSGTSQFFNAAWMISSIGR